jgi:hypothetical protein
VGRAISNSTPLQVVVRRVDEYRSFATLTLADKIEIANIRIKTKRGTTRVLWPTIPENAGNSGGRHPRVFPIERILDEQVRMWMENEILKAWNESQSQTPVQVVAKEGL